MEARTTRRSVKFWAPIALVSLALLGAACAPPPSGGGPSQAERRFCQLWDKVDDAPPTPDTAVLVANDVVALAEDVELAGGDCRDLTARIELDGAVVAEGEEVPSELGGAPSAPIAAITGEEIGAGEPVLENVRITALSASIGRTGITVRGNVAVRLSGTTSTIGFVGNLQNLDNWSINLSSTSFTVPGITSSPATFSGTLSARNKVPTLSLRAQATSARIGDITVTGANIDVVASPATGLSAKVAGNLRVGPSTVSGVVDVDFDRVGALVSAEADLTTRLVGTQADGKPIDLQGSVKLSGNRTETVASFSGSGVVGDLQVNEANGSLSLAPNRATFVGSLDVAQGANSVRFNGSIIWELQSGVVTAFTPFLTLEGEGEISGTLADGQRVTASGSIQAEVIGGQLRSVLTGSFRIGTLRANGTAVVESSGATTVLELDADLVDAGFAARIEGAVIITDGRAETVHLDAAITGTLQLGDATLTGASMSVRSSYGSPIDISFSGGLQIGSRANLTASLDASIGPNGTLLSLRGDVFGSLNLNSWSLINFSGSVVATIDQVTVTGRGGVSLTNFPLGLQLNGSFTQSLNSPSWSLSGSARFRLGSLDIASARMNLSQTEGMRATRAGFYFSIIGIPTYFEGNFYMRPQGGCDKVDITGGGLIAKLILVTVLPGAIGCPVYI